MAELEDEETEMTADQKVDVGNRVRIADLFFRRNFEFPSVKRRMKAKRGTVVGFSRFRDCVRVRFDGYKSADSWHMSYLTRIRP